VPLTVNADPAQLQNALLNLAINARDAMPNGGTLAIQAAARHIGPHPFDAPGPLAAGDYVTLTVSDSGAGMTREVAVRALEPFFTTKAPGRGSGLGLSTVYGFAQQSGGGLEIESVPGKGTSVVLLLPAVRAGAGRAPGDSPRARERSDSGTVLVVEDEPRVRKLARRALVELGYRVLDAKDAEGAQRILESQPGIDLLFSDVVMPGSMDGHALARWASERRPGIHVLLTTGFNEATAGHPTAPGQVYPLLKKPYSEEDLRAAIDAALRSGPAPVTAGQPGP
jgi:CheY-like chemotaxis protein